MLQWWGRIYLILIGKIHFFIFFLASSSFGDVLKGLFDICGILGWYLKELDVAMRFAPLLCLGFLDLSFCCFIQFISEDNKGEMFWILGLTLHEELISPRVEVIKWLRIGDIVNQHTTISTSVEGSTKRLESLLTCSVPNLYFEIKYT